MQVLILRNTIADGRAVRAGQVIDLPDADARALLRMGRAGTVDTAPAQPAPAAPLDTEQAAAVVPEVKKKGRARRAG